jgi:hypothetical protein
MAMAYCVVCDNYRDLDYESEGQWNDDGEYICESCVEHMEEEVNGEDFRKPKVPFDRKQRFCNVTGRLV